MSEAPPCRICKSNKWVAIWSPEKPEDTICVECCGGNVEHADGETGHQFENEPGIGLMCRYCGSQDVPNDYYYE